MGVRTRKKARNKSRYRIAAKRRKASANKKINPSIQCSAVKSAWDSSLPASSNVANMGLVYNLGKVGVKSTRQTLLAGSSKSKKGGISTTAVKQLEEEVSKLAKKEKPGIRLTNVQVMYASAMLDKYGNDYKAMARDPQNHFQETPKQIEKKIKQFTSNPKYFVPYLRKRGKTDQEAMEES